MTAGPSARGGVALVSDALSTNDSRLVAAARPGPGVPVLDVLPRYLAKDEVVAVGEVGYDSMTPAEDEAFARQLELAGQHDLPVLVHTPHRDKAAGAQRSLDVPRMTKILAEYGTERMLVNSAADWGRSDPVATAKTAQAMLDVGFDESDVDVVLWQNPVAFYQQSGRLNLADLPGFAPSSPTFSGNSVPSGGSTG